MTRAGSTRSARRAAGLGARFALALALLAWMAPASAQRALSNFPVQVEGGIRGAPALADVDGDGRRDVIVAAGAFLTAVGDDGLFLPGFPRALGGEAVGDVAAADVDGDGRAEALVVTDGGSVWLVEGDGQPAPGFPVRLAGGARAGGALLDVDHDGRLEAVVGGNDGRLHAFRTDGTARPAGAAGAPPEAAGFPVAVGAEVTSAPAYADLGPAGTPAWTLLVGAADGGLHAFGPTGPRPGFPVRARYLVAGQPSVADLDDDGLFDVVFTSQDYRVYAVDARGRSLPGFPFETGYRLYAGPALVDLNDDGLPEIAFAGGDRKLYALDRRGAPLEGFPVDLGAKVEAGVVAADVDRDGTPDLVAVTVDGRLHVVTAAGRPLAGWPVDVGGRVTATPMVADFVGDGFAEIVVGTLEGRLAAFKSGRRGEAPAAYAWPTHGHDAARSGRLHPNPSRFQAQAIVPKAPISTEPLKAQWTHVDLDREPEGDLELVWERNGQEVPELRGAREVPAAATRKGERWRFSVRSRRDGARARRFVSPEVVIGNAVPGPPEVRLEPPSPITGAALKARLVTAATDPDDDRLVYHYAWYRNGQAVDLEDGAAAVPAGTIHKGERWRVAVRAYDGLAESASSEATTEVVNSAPSDLEAVLEPAAPKVTDALVVRITRAPTDLDGDPLVVHHRWSVRGADAGIALDRERLAPGLARAGDEVVLRLRAFDGDVEGPEQVLRAVVANTPPAAPEVELVPARPTTGQDLVARLVTPAADPDGDLVRYRYRWTLDGAPVEVAGERVDGARVHAGQTWRVAVVASDAVEGGRAEAEAKVADTPPAPPVIAAEPADPRPGQAVIGRVLTPATDVDGDEVTLAWVWTEASGAKVEGAALPPGRVRKGERWTVTATPKAAGTQGASSSAEVEVGNTPPPAPAVTLAPSAPLGDQALSARVELAPDADGDPLTPRVRWLLDGRPVADLDDVAQVPGSRVRRDQVWTVRVQAGDGEAWSRAAQATVRVGDRPPTAPEVAVRPEAPRTTDALRCVVTRPARDPDGDALDTRLRWERDEAATGHLGELLAPEATRKHERWRCVATVWAGDVRVDGAPSAPVTVANTPPGAPALAIEPARPVTGSPLRCAVSDEAADADGDRLSWRYAWRLDGQAAGGLTGPDVPGARVRKGQTWACAATPSDGEVAGPTAQAEATVANSPPTAPSVQIEPAAPKAGDELRCAVVEAATDPDGDPITYAFRWYLDGEVQPFAPTSVAVRGRLVEAGQRWRCGVTAGDGADTGAEGRSKEVDVGAVAPAVAQGGLSK